MKIRLSLIIFLIAISFGCEKDHEVPQYNPISQGLYPFLFDKGSFWVYKMVGSNVEDSITAESIDKSFIYVPHISPDEYYQINYHDVTDGFYYNDYLVGYIICRCLGPSGYPSGYLLLTSKKIGDKSEDAEIVDVLDSMLVENHLFKQVVKMKIISGNCITENYFLYYVDSIGMIKKERFENDSVLETWNITNYKINLLKLNNTYRDIITEITQKD